MDKIMSPQDIEATKDRVSKMMSVLRAAAPAGSALNTPSGQPGSPAAAPHAQPREASHSRLRRSHSALAVPAAPLPPSPTRKRAGTPGPPADMPDPTGLGADDEAGASEQQQQQQEPGRHRGDAPAAQHSPRQGQAAGAGTGGQDAAPGGLRSVRSALALAVAGSTRQQQGAGAAAAEEARVGAAGQAGGEELAAAPSGKAGAGAEGARHRGAPASSRSTAWVDNEAGGEGAWARRAGGGAPGETEVASSAPPAVHVLSVDDDRVNQVRWCAWVGGAGRRSFGARWVVWVPAARSMVMRWLRRALLMLGRRW